MNAMTTITVAARRPRRADGALLARVCRTSAKSSSTEATCRSTRRSPRPPTALALQTQKLPAFIAKLDKRALVIDPMIDSGSGPADCADAADRGQGHRAPRRATIMQLPVLPFQLSEPESLAIRPDRHDDAAAGASAARWPRAVPDRPGAHRDQERAWSSHRRRPARATTAWTRRRRPYYRDSPVLVKDKVVDGYIATSRTASPASPPRKTTSSASRPRPRSTRRPSPTTTIKYQAVARPVQVRACVALGRPIAHIERPLSRKLEARAHAQEAEQAFGKVVALGIANNSLGVKLLFNPGTTDFWSDPKVSGPYAIWLRQIAKQMAQAKVCMNIVGHTSRTGRGCLQRASSRPRARRSSGRSSGPSQGTAELLGRTKTSGAGSRENIIGSGTDDAGRFTGSAGGVQDRGLLSADALFASPSRRCWRSAGAAKLNTGVPGSSSTRCSAAAPR